MPAVEERIAYLEGQVNEHPSMFLDIRETMRHFEQRMDARFDALRGCGRAAHARVGGSRS